MTPLGESVSRVLADLTYGLEAEADVTAQPVVGGPGYWDIVAAFGDGTEIGFRVDVDGQPPAALLAAVADGLQTAFIEHLRSAVPLCPGHPHPLTAATRGDAGVWICPATGETRCAIGDYGALIEAEGGTATS